jgi:hypothetical protein
MGPDASWIMNSQDQRSRMILGGEVAWGLILESRPKFKPWFSFGVTWHHQVHFRVKSGLPQTTFSCPRNLEKYKREFWSFILFYFECWTVKTLARPPSFNCSSTVHQLHAISTRFQVFFITTMDPIITSVTEQDPVENEEALIDRDSRCFLY